MAKAKTKQLGTDLVPHATGVVYSDLCHVRRSKSCVVQAGTLLAYNGAWDRKAVVAYVVYGGSYVDNYGHTQHDYTVGIQPLGHFYADGRVVPTTSPVYERKLTVSAENTVGHYEMNRLMPVEPFVPPVKGQPLQVSPAGAWSKAGDYGWPIVAGNGAPPPAPPKPAKASVPKAQPMPEAVLAQFIIN